MEKIDETKKTKLQQKIELAKDTIKRKAIDVYTWCKQNPDLAASIFGATVISGLKIKKDLQRTHARKEERELKERFIYDPRMRHYCECKRKPTKQEWQLIDDFLMDEDRRNEMSLQRFLDYIGLLK